MTQVSPPLCQPIPINAAQNNQTTKRNLPRRLPPVIKQPMTILGELIKLNQQAEQYPNRSRQLQQSALPKPHQKTSAASTPSLPQRFWTAYCPPEEAATCHSPAPKSPSPIPRADDSPHRLPASPSLTALLASSPLKDPSFLTDDFLERDRRLCNQSQPPA